MELTDLIQTFLGEEKTSKLVPGRILAVDDDEGNLVVMEELLSEKYDVAITTSPDKALELATSTEFDMVLSDQRMPGITGVELLRKVRDAYPQTVRVIISAYADSKAMLQAINVGEVYRFIMKPWEADDVLAVVRQGLEYRLSMLVIVRLVQELHGKNVDLVKTLEELRQTQEKLLHSAKLATVGQLTSSIVREMKNHVTGVKLLADSVGPVNLPPELAEYVKLGVTSAQSLFELVSGINAFATRDEWKLKRSRVPFNSVLEEALSVVRLDSRTGQVLVKLVPGDGVGSAVVDAEKVRQVVVNLVRNGLDATSAGGRIEVVSGVENDGRLFFEVRDDGEGMTEEVAQHAFDPFFTTRKDALGLGLEVCRRVVEAHGGEVKLSSAPGRGTAVHVALPIEPGCENNRGGVS